jgi:transketolase
VKSISSTSSPILEGPPQLTDLPHFDIGESIATRVAIQKAIEASSEQMPGLLIGAADLTGNTGAKDSKLGPQSAANPAGRQIYYGIREHAMGAIAVGLALHGGTLPVVGTFFVFADYMRPAIRLAALSRAKCLFVFSHDSVGVGEDGPTHQPVEHLASLRSIPGLRVIRPADANETIEAWRIAVSSEGPTALVLSRQNLPVISDGTAVLTGAGLVREHDGAAVTLVATGSEVSVALAAAEVLKAQDIHTRVVSMPSWDLFMSQPLEFRREIFPAAIPTISVEAGTTFGWAAFSDHQIGIDRFGASAPGSEALERLGISVEAIVAKVKEIRS